MYGSERLSAGILLQLLFGAYHNENEILNTSLLSNSFQNDNYSSSMNRITKS